MKKRIIALILAVVTIALSLAGCAYNYAKDDLGDYAQYDKDAFKNALLALSIEGADFYDDDENRKNEVIDAIYEKLAEAVPADDDKISENKAGAHDILYYCYYATFVNENKKLVQLESAQMTGVNATKVNLQLGMINYDKTLDKAISEAMKR